MRISLFEVSPSIKAVFDALRAVLAEDPTRTNVNAYASTATNGTTVGITVSDKFSSSATYSEFITTGRVFLEPQTGAAGPGETVQFAATTLDATGQPVPATVAWTLQAGALGSVNATGLYTAPAAIAVAATDYVTARDAGESVGDRLYFPSPMKTVSKVSTGGKAMKIEGVPELIKTVRAIAATLEGEGAAQFVERVKQVCLKPALVIRDETRELVPVKTGTLKAGIFAALMTKRVGAVVGVHNVEYAPFVEYGTSKNPANPYLRPSVAATRPLFANMMAGDLTKLIEDVGGANAVHPAVNK